MECFGLYRREYHHVYVMIIHNHKFYLGKHNVLKKDKYILRIKNKPLKELTGSASDAYKRGSICTIRSFSFK